MTRDSHRQSCAHGDGFQRRVRFVLVMSGLFVGSLLVTYLVELQPVVPSTKSVPQRSSLEIESDHLNFGMAYAQRGYPWTLPVTNHSSQVVKIKEIKSSCACTALEPRCLNIPPGGTEEINVTLNLTQKDEKTAELPIRPFLARLLPIIEGRRLGDIVWELRGNVSNELRLNPTSVLYGQTSLVRGRPIPTKTVNLESTKPLKSVEASCDNSMGSVTVVPRGRDNRRYEIAVSPNEELPLGRFQFRIPAIATTSHDERLPPLYLYVRGTIYPDIQAFPRELSLGQQYLNRPVVADVVLASARREAFAVMEVQHGHDVASVAPQNSEASHKHGFTVTVVPTGVAQQESHLDFIIQKPGAEPQRVAVRIRYYVFDESKSVRIPTQHAFDEA